MSSTRETKQRIKNIQSVEQLINAMHMVSTTQLRRANRQLDGIIPVHTALRRKIHELASNPELKGHPYYEQRPVKKSLYLVITGDRGLDGSYNQKVQKFALEQMEGKNERIIAVGLYGARFFKRNDKHIVKALIDLPESQVYYKSEEISDYMIEAFLSGKVDEVFVIFTRFENVLSSNPVIEKIFPLEKYEDQPSVEDLEPDAYTYLDNLIPFCLHMFIFRAYSEALTSEQASRMLAMDTASDNAHELVEDLQRNLNRQRQQEITQELSEIVGQRQ